MANWPECARPGQLRAGGGAALAGVEPRAVPAAARLPAPAAGARLPPRAQVHAARGAAPCCH
eukprot:scaffold515_cov101-Isochrysis_galbana.AAC.7